jgi:hypothetical protein
VEQPEGVPEFVALDGNLGVAVADSSNVDADLGDPWSS